MSKHGSTSSYSGTGGTSGHGRSPSGTSQDIKLSIPRHREGSATRTADRSSVADTTSVRSSSPAASQRSAATSKKSYDAVSVATTTKSGLTNTTAASNRTGATTNTAATNRTGATTNTAATNRTGLTTNTTGSQSQVETGIPVIRPPLLQQQQYPGINTGAAQSAGASGYQQYQHQQLPGSNAGAAQPTGASAYQQYQQHQVPGTNTGVAPQYHQQQLSGANVGVARPPAQPVGPPAPQQYHQQQLSGANVGVARPPAHPVGPPAPQQYHQQQLSGANVGVARPPAHPVGPPAPQQYHQQQLSGANVGVARPPAHPVGPPAPQQYHQQQLSGANLGVARPPVQPVRPPPAQQQYQQHAVQPGGSPQGGLNASFHGASVPAPGGAQFQQQNQARFDVSKAIFNQVDSNRDGAISREEFQRWAESGNQAGGQHYSQQQHAQYINQAPPQIFNGFDPAHGFKDVVLNIDYGAMEAYNVGIKSSGDLTAGLTSGFDAAKAIFKQADANHDGSISRDEFRRWAQGGHRNFGNTQSYAGANPGISNILQQSGLGQAYANYR